MLSHIPHIFPLAFGTVEGHILLTLTFVDGSGCVEDRERGLEDVKRFFLCFCDDKLKGTKRARHWANGAESDERAVDVELPSLGGQHLIPRHEPSPNQTPTSVLHIRSLSSPLCSQLPSCNQPPLRPLHLPLLGLAACLPACAGAG